MRSLLLLVFTSLLYSQDSWDQPHSQQITPQSESNTIRPLAATLSNFNIAANPPKLVLVVGSSGTMTITQTNPAFTGTVSYNVLNLSGISFQISMIGNTALITFSVPIDTPLGTKFGIVQGGSNGTLKQIPVSFVINDRPKIIAPGITGSISMTSVPGAGQLVDYTTLGTSDWVASGGTSGSGMSCPFNGPCATSRKVGGSGLVAAINAGNGDGWFYPFTPNLISPTWSDGTTAPNGSASHISNTFIQMQAFAGVQPRVLTVVAGIAGSGSLVTNLHLSDGSTADVTSVSSFNDTGVRVFTIRFNSSALGHQLVVTMSHSGGELILYGAALSGTLAPQTHLLQLTDNLAAFVAAVTGGDTLVLPDGYLYRGHLILPVRKDSGWVEIKSNTSIPPGQRVLPGDLKAAIISPDEQPAIQNDMNNADHGQRPTHGWRFTGIEVTANNRVAQLSYGLIAFGFGDNPVAADISHDVVFQRCYVHGDGVNNYIKGIIGNVNNFSVIDSYLSGFVSTFMEANAINIYSSAGPIQIVNNYLEATAENIMIGGAGPDVGPVFIPTNGLIQHNYFKKLTSWRGSAFIVKNLLEFKNGYNFVVDSNVFENCWAAAQNGFAILLTPRTTIFNGATTSATSIFNHVDTISFTNNVLRHSGSGFNIGIYDDLARDLSGQPIPPAQLQWVHDITLRNNLLDDLSLNYAPMTHGVQIFGPPNNLVLDHNTINFAENTNDQGWWLVNDTGVKPSNASITGNDFGADLYGDSRGPGDAILTGAVFSGNNIRNGSSKWKSTPYAQSVMLEPVAPAGVGADVTGLLIREASVKSGNRP